MIFFSQEKDTLRLELINKQLPFGLTELVPANLPKVGLALSGGGARAISQVGMLRALEEYKIPVEIIVGTSMGSIIGGLYSAGYSIDELDSIAINTDWIDLFSAEQSKRNELFVDQKVTEDKAILSLRLDGLKPILPRALNSGIRGANFLNILAINAPIQATDNYNNFRFVYRAVSTDLVNGRQVLLDSGPLSLSMQASSSVTLLLPPVKSDTLLLVDGGLVANIPVKETRKLGAEIVIACNAVSPLYQESELNYPWIIADQLISIPMQILNEQQLEEADFIIQPDLGVTKNTDFYKVNELIGKGYSTALQKISFIESEFKRQFKKNLNIDEVFYKNVFVKEAPPGMTYDLMTTLSKVDSVSNKEILYQLYRYQSSGKYKDIFAEIEAGNNSSYLAIITKENPEVKYCNYSGISLLDGEIITLKLVSLMGKTFNPKSTYEVLLSVLQEYRKRGFIAARIEKVEFDEATQTLHVIINEGKISNIRIDGNIKTNEQIISREFSINSGEPLLASAANKGLTNLRSTNLFEQIEIDVNKHNEENELKIKVLERPSSIIRFGMRIDNENFTQFSFDVRDENVYGTGTELGAIFSGGLRNRTYILEHRANRIFDSYLTYKIRAFYEFNDVNVYKNDSAKVHNRFSRSKTGEYRQIFYGGSFGIGSQVGRFGNLLVEGKYQRDEIKNKLDYSGSTYKEDISSLRVSLSIDSQNQYPYPTEGFLVKTYYETAQTALGGDVGYTKFFFDYKSISTLHNSPHTVSFRTMIGFADETLPLSQHFSFGGQNSFFGFRDDEFRGRQIFTASLEYRFKLPIKLFFDTYLKTRYDLGSIWNDREQIRFNDLRHGVGLSLAFNTPIGPADFSIGKSFYLKDAIPKNKVVWGQTFFYFTIGYYY
jgi:NTE family protein